MYRFSPTKRSLVESDRGSYKYRQDTLIHAEREPWHSRVDGREDPCDSSEASCSQNTEERKRDWIRLV